MRIQSDPRVSEVPNRQRAWGASLLGGTGGTVVVRHYIADLAPGEEIDDYPETHELTWDEWLARHADYGLDVSGR